jgi:hypothetical protein
MIRSPSLCNIPTGQDMESYPTYLGGCKGKVILVLNLIKHYAIKVYGEGGCNVRVVLTTALAGGEE